MPKGRTPRYTGDLDNYVTGICDGLMMAAKRSLLNECWGTQEYQYIHPLHCSFTMDDSEITKMQAEKIMDNPGRVWYEVILEGN